MLVFKSQLYYWGQLQVCVGQSNNSLLVCPPSLSAMYFLFLVIDFVWIVKSATYLLLGIIYPLYWYITLFEFLTDSRPEWTPLVCVNQSVHILHSNTPKEYRWRPRQSGPLYCYKNVSVSWARCCESEILN